MRAERRGERDGCCVGASASERRHVERVRRDALESCNKHDPVAVERLVDAPRADVDDLRLPMDGVGDDAGLRAR
jgi:hypothetical protein